MRVRTTSTQRTYRYVRLGIVAAAVLLGVSIGAQTATGGLLPSLSAGYYTAAGPMFVAALCVVGFAFLALSGRSIEQGLLDIAAVLALVVAVVPTTVAGPGCPADRCVPATVVPTVINNGVAVASVVLLGLITAIVLALTQGSARRGTAWTIAVVAAVTGAFVGWALIDLEDFLRLAHTVAAVGFFAIIGAVGALAAWHPQRSPRRFRPLYAFVAIAISVTLVLLILSVVGVGGRTGDGPWVFVGESIVLVLFAVFWVVQTVELWNDPDPALVSGVRQTPYRPSAPAVSR